MSDTEEKPEGLDLGETQRITNALARSMPHTLSYTCVMQTHLARQNERIIELLESIDSRLSNLD